MNIIECWCRLSFMKFHSEIIKEWQRRKKEIFFKRYCILMENEVNECIEHQTLQQASKQSIHWEERFLSINLNGHNFKMPVNFNFNLISYSIKWFNQKVFQKQFQSSLIEMCKWFWFDGNNNNKNNMKEMRIFG